MGCCLRAAKPRQQVPTTTVLLVKAARGPEADLPEPPSRRTSFGVVTTEPRVFPVARQRCLIRWQLCLQRLESLCRRLSRRCCHTRRDPDSEDEAASASVRAPRKISESLRLRVERWLAGCELPEARKPGVAQPAEVQESREDGLLALKTCGSWSVGKSSSGGTPQSFATHTSFGWDDDEGPLPLPEDPTSSTNSVPEPQRLRTGKQITRLQLVLRQREMRGNRTREPESSPTSPDTSADSSPRVAEPSSPPHAGLLSPLSVAAMMGSPRSPPEMEDSGPHASPNSRGLRTPGSVGPYDPRRPHSSRSSARGGVRNPLCVSPMMCSPPAGGRQGSSCSWVSGTDEKLSGERSRGSRVTPSTRSQPDDGSAGIGYAAPPRDGVLVAVPRRSTNSFESAATAATVVASSAPRSQSPEHARAVSPAGDQQVTLPKRRRP
eukprot:TRINITY_DN31828_c0_g1_i1.p1 TRINITY_DN31828_c0_g1~~TRINITY_DN31828_c0_g1_i1.p1  ORF type:complete len:436 (+),score=43.28 TRINITY_DN31828_c0_g1_i1:117-1424(+)